MSKFPDIDWNTSALHKELNPELQTSFTDFNVKFHYHSLEQIINIEKNQKVVAFLKESQLLYRFSKFHPLITGTIPLAINIETSDLDILFQSENFEEFTKHVLEFFPKSVIRIEQDYVLAIFKHNDLNIEFFCQKIHPLKQRAHQHLRIEARLLKLLGVHFRRRIIQLKREGFKTEPAFGELLALDNPYEDLLQLNTLSDIDLLQRFSHLKDL